jgi:hypothetical protein
MRTGKDEPENFGDTPHERRKGENRGSKGLRDVIFGG